MQLNAMGNQVNLLTFFSNSILFLPQGPVKDSAKDAQKVALLAKDPTTASKDKETHAVSANTVKVLIGPLVVFCYDTYSKYVSV